MRVVKVCVIVLVCVCMCAVLQKYSSTVSLYPTTKLALKEALAVQQLHLIAEGLAGKDILKIVSPRQGWVGSLSV